LRSPSHKVTSIEEIWLEDALAWSSSGGVQGIYAGFLTVTTILEGGASPITPSTRHALGLGAAPDRLRVDPSADQAQRHEQPVHRRACRAA
jgi:hypothetical protein